MSRSKQVVFRLTSDDLDTIQFAAKARGLTLSAFLRDAALAYVTASHQPTGPICGCGATEGLAWIVVDAGGGIRFGSAPFAASSITGAPPWMGWKCRRCCLRDHGWFVVGAA